MVVSWLDYPENLGKPGHIPRGHEWEALLDRLATLSPILVSVKTADETINNVGTYQDDDHLSLPVEANATYVYHVNGAYNSGATPDFRYEFSIPSGSFSSSYFEYLDSSGGVIRTSYSNPTTGGTAGFSGGLGRDQPFEFGGVYTCGATAGTWRFRWAQDVANASNTIVRAGSRFTAYRVA